MSDDGSKCFICAYESDSDEISEEPLEHLKLVPRPRDVTNPETENLEKSGWTSNSDDSPVQKLFPGMGYLALRVIGAYAYGMLSAILFSMGVSLSFQNSFNAWGDVSQSPSTQYNNKFTIIICLPVSVLFFGFLCAQSFCLLSDSVTIPPLPQTRSFMLITLDLPPCKMSLVDHVLAWSFAAIVGSMMLLGFALGDWQVGCWGGVFIWAVLLLIIYTVTKLRVLYSPCDSVKWKSLVLSLNGLGSEGYDNLSCDTSDKECPHKKPLWAFLGIAISVSCLLILAVLTQIWPRIVFVSEACCLVIYILLPVFIYWALPAGSAGLFPCLSMLYISFGIIALLGSYQEAPQEDGDWQPMFSGAKYSPSLWTSLPKHRQYPICGLRWGNLQEPYENRLTVLDVLALAEAIYKFTEEEVFESAHSAFKGTPHEAGLKLAMHESQDFIGKPGLFMIPSAKVCVLAIRGSQTVPDYMIDTEMWSFVKGVQLLNRYFPVITLLPVGLVQTLVYGTDWRWWCQKREVWEDVLDKAKEAAQKCDSLGHQMIVTGHSLGGGLAQIISSQLNIPALTFSPVGVLYSLKHFHMLEQAVIENVVNVVPLNDPVPMIDEQIGFTQKIKCTASPIECHLLARTACELYASCGDPRARAHNSTMTVRKHCEDLFGTEFSR